jgi:hypothetical protein
MIQRTASLARRLLARARKRDLLTAPPADPSERAERHLEIACSRASGAAPEDELRSRLDHSEAAARLLPRLAGRALLADLARWLAQLPEDSLGVRGRLYLQVWRAGRRAELARQARTISSRRQRAQDLLAGRIAEEAPRLSPHTQELLAIFAGLPVGEPVAGATPPLAAGVCIRLANLLPRLPYSLHLRGAVLLRHCGYAHLLTPHLRSPQSAEDRALGAVLAVAARDRGAELSEAVAVLVGTLSCDGRQVHCSAFKEGLAWLARTPGLTLEPVALRTCAEALADLPQPAGVHVLSQVAASFVALGGAEAASAQARAWASDPGLAAHDRFEAAALLHRLGTQRREDAEDLIHEATPRLDPADFDELDADELARVLVAFPDLAPALVGLAARWEQRGDSSLASAGLRMAALSLRIPVGSATTFWESVAGLSGLPRIRLATRGLAALARRGEVSNVRRLLPRLFEWAGDDPYARNEVFLAQAAASRVVAREQTRDLRARTLDRSLGHALGAARRAPLLCEGAGELLKALDRLDPARAAPRVAEALEISSDLDWRGEVTGSDPVARYWSRCLVLSVAETQGVLGAPLAEAVLFHAYEDSEQDYDLSSLVEQALSSTLPRGRMLARTVRVAARLARGGPRSVETVGMLLAALAEASAAQD